MDQYTVEQNGKELALTNEYLLMSCRKRMCPDCGMQRGSTCPISQIGYIMRRFKVYLLVDYTQDIFSFQWRDTVAHFRVV